MTIRLTSAFFHASVAAAALLVAGCGSKSEKEVASGTYTDPETGETADYKVTSSEDGEAGNVTIKTADGEVSFGGGAAHAKLPAGIAPYPGARMTGGLSSTGKDGTAGMASFEVEGKAADVIAHFRKQVEAQGMKVTSEITADQTMMFAAQKADDDKSGMQFTATQEGDQVTGSVTYGHRR
ncbi:hypothetical protein [Sphingopyxis sp. 113P3]|uniref:hypothetical protein n=1 Tax=Sphingopyxis sp. (strain 113P3) TaxID=292913 RepID=UPI0006AD5296|nr:hypothetical protein [Sphingopyxis sp. 113P3]ALC12630.1 hypothetical protein LH20_11770 [Sphingopyxis sp. 113P3]